MYDCDDVNTSTDWVESRMVLLLAVCEELWPKSIIIKTIVADSLI
jgi:hypothetical protein